MEISPQRMFIFATIIPVTVGYFIGSRIEPTEVVPWIGPWSLALVLVSIAWFLMFLRRLSQSAYKQIPVYWVLWAASVVVSLYLVLPADWPIWSPVVAGIVLAIVLTVALGRRFARKATPKASLATRRSHHDDDGDNDGESGSSGKEARIHETLSALLHLSGEKGDLTVNAGKLLENIARQAEIDEKRATAEHETAQVAQRQQDLDHAERLISLVEKGRVPAERVDATWQKIQQLLGVPEPERADTVAEAKRELRKSRQRIDWGRRGKSHNGRRSRKED